MDLENKVSQAVDDFDKKRALEQARKYEGTRSKIGTVKSFRALTPVFLLKYMHPLEDFPYLLALFAAVIKDLLDYAIIGSIPGVGFVITACCSILIFFMMLLVGSGSTRKKVKVLVSGPMKKSLAIAIGFIMEIIFGINFLPIETAVVVIIYIMLLKDRRIASEGGEEGGQEEEYREAA